VLKTKETRLPQSVNKPMELLGLVAVYLLWVYFLVTDVVRLFICLLIFFSLKFKIFKNKVCKTCRLIFIVYYFYIFVYQKLV
jgi:hypothetical protein